MQEIDVHQQQLLQAARARETDLPERRERRAEVLLGGATLVAMALLWLFPLAGPGSWLAGAGCVIAVVVTTRVRFDVGGGFTVPLQLAFVPLLFAIPAQAVPLAVVIAMAAARVPDIVSGHSSVWRLPFAIRNAAF